VRVEKLPVPACNLGESPVWSDRDGCLYYVDIFAQKVFAYSPGTGAHRAFSFDGPVGSLGECKSGGLIVAVGDRLVHFDPRRGEESMQTIVALEADRPDNRLNDGKVDPWGRFWVGSLRMTEGPNAGRLWCVSGSGEKRAVRDGIGISNSAAFDRARRRMYFADSTGDTIEMAEFDEHLELGPFSSFAKAGRGSPDGSCTDAAGRLWNAEWGGHRICVYAPDGSVERTLDLPVSRPSSCTFGGERHRTLFVTTAQHGMNAEELARDASAGMLLSVELEDAEGLPADLFDW
jgi:sugar lactone lactonase YvrE